MQVGMKCRFEITGNTLAHGFQTDVSSCGLFAFNMIEHAILGENLLDATALPAYRAKLFANL